MSRHLPVHRSSGWKADARSFGLRLRLSTNHSSPNTHWAPWLHTFTGELSHSGATSRDSQHLRYAVPCYNKARLGEPTDWISYLFFLLDHLSTSLTMIPFLAYLLSVSVGRLFSARPRICLGGWGMESRTAVV